MTADEARRLADRVLGLVKADSAEVTVSEAREMHLRHAANDITTNGAVGRRTLTLTVGYGRRSATAATNQSDDAAVAALVEKAQAMARLAPEDPEHVPPLGPAEFAASRAWSDAAASASPEEMIGWVRPVIERARESGVDSAGFLKLTSLATAIAATSGLFVHDRSTSVGFSMTARTPDGRGSGWASGQANDPRELDAAAIGERAMHKAIDSRNPRERAPGRTTVVLEPAAVRDLVSWFVGNLDRRAFDEGRSFLNRLADGKDPVGEKLFSEKATLVSDPLDPAAPCETHAGGMPLARTRWIERGVLRTLACGRFWAAKRGIPPQPPFHNLLMTGEGRPLDELVGVVDDGVLITRIWYLRSVDPQTMLLTGLTRDGTFAISKGRIDGPVKNFRFNESPARLLSRIVASGTPVRVLGSEGDTPVSIPAVVVEDFNLSSISDAS